MVRSSLDHVESKHVRKDLVEFRAGDTVRVHWKVKEGDKERVQPFEGIVIRKTKGYNRATFTVRKISYGIGVERIFPLHSPRYEKIEVLTRGHVHRSRLFYLRDLKGKASRVETQADKFESRPAAASAPVAAPADPASAPEAVGGDVPPAESKPPKKARASAPAAK